MTARRPVLRIGMYFLTWAIGLLCFDCVATPQTVTGQQSQDNRSSLILAAVEEGRWDAAENYAAQWIAAEPRAAVAAFVDDVAMQVLGEQAKLSRTKYDFPYNDTAAMKNIQGWTLRALQNKPENANLLILAGMVYSPIAMEDNTELVGLFEKAKASSPNNGFILEVLGTSYGGEGKYDAAIEMLHKAIMLRPQSSGAYTNLGTAYLKNGNISEALIAYRKAVKVNEEDGMAWFNLGSCLAEHGQVQEAELDLEKAITLNPKLLEARWNLGGIYFNSGDRQKAVEQLREMIRIAPESSMGRQAQQMLRQLGQ
jgi:tetratricopeptide (TPR) repeat protein